MHVRSAPASTLSTALLSSGAGGRPALIAAAEQLTYADLVERVEQRASTFDLAPRSLVTLTGANSIEFVVSYLALIGAGHVPVLAGDHAARVSRTWPVSASVTATDLGFDVERRAVRAPDLHPDLALLVSTSGSTGSPKLVRLSHRNLVSNAEAIVQFQSLTEADRGITSLPLQYCFGLSVLHSHLLAGAGLVVTDGSVVDRCFRDAVGHHGVTNLAGVPYTYEMLDRVGAHSIFVPTLRMLTQAGGRMAPDAVSAWAERARGHDVEFFVMYGQTEATARIAYLPPGLVSQRPDAVGRAIPGSTLELRPVDGATDVGADGVGELVVRGPNVMMGYALDPGDLAAGHTLDELATGDLARFDAADEVYEIVGRRSRFVKPFGLRIDLDDVESRLSVVGELAVAGDDRRIVAVAPGTDPCELRRRVADVTGLPEIGVVAFDRSIPRLASGKVDYLAIGGLSADLADRTANDLPAVHRAEAPESDVVAEIFAEVLGRRTVGPDDTFVTLGGDSLSYVECSIRLERRLGYLPADWHLVPVSGFAPGVAPRRRWARLDTTVLLRALCICLVVSTHMRFRHLPGGAHTLLAVAGYNLARFMAPLESTKERVAAGFRTASRAAVPTMVWVGVGMLAFGSYGLGTLFLINNYIGPASHDGDHWHFWFIEAFVQLVLIVTLLLAVPAVRRAERRFPFLLPLGVLGITLVLRMDWSHMGDWYNLRFRTHGIAWFFVLGWLIQRSVSTLHRLVASLVCLAVVPGFFHVAAREWRILVLLLVLVWVREIPVPRWSVSSIGTLAAASMWIYVSHFSIWPLFDSVFIREVAYVLTIVAGVVVWFAAERLLGLLNTCRQGSSRLRTTPLLRGST